VRRSGGGGHRQIGPGGCSRVGAAWDERVDDPGHVQSRKHRPDGGQVAEFLVQATDRGTRPGAGQLGRDLLGAAELLLGHDPWCAVHACGLDQVVIGPPVRTALLDHRRHMWVIHQSSRNPLLRNTDTPQDHSIQETQARSANLTGLVTRWLWGASSASVAEDTGRSVFGGPDPLAGVGAMVATVV
jgi:hypothetical protein